MLERTDLPHLEANHCVFQLRGKRILFTGDTKGGRDSRRKKKKKGFKWERGNVEDLCPREERGLWSCLSYRARFVGPVRIIRKIKERGY